jgi:hypothetical protein
MQSGIHGWQLLWPLCDDHEVVNVDIIIGKGWCGGIIANGDGSWVEVRMLR